MLHPSSQIPCMLYSDTLYPLDSQLPVLQLVHLSTSPVSSITRWTSLIYLQPCLHTAYGFGQTSCRCYLLWVPHLTAFYSSCNSFSNFWPVFFISLGKELITLSLPMFQANNLDHFSVWNQPVIFILQNFMFLQQKDGRRTGTTPFLYIFLVLPHSLSALSPAQSSYSVFYMSLLSLRYHIQVVKISSISVSH